MSRVGFMRRCEQAGTRARSCEAAIDGEEARLHTEDGSAMRCDDEVDVCGIDVLRGTWRRTWCQRRMFMMSIDRVVLMDGMRSEMFV
jgi:hypothetical protein